MDASSHGGLWRRASVKVVMRRVANNAILPPWFFRGTKFATRVGESSSFISFMVILALFSIFSDDIRLSSFPKNADAGFEAATTAIFFVFLLEILMTCYYKEDYMTLPSMRKRSKEKGPSTWKSLIKRFKLGSFYFWLDLIAAFSLVVEIQWIVGRDTVDSKNVSLFGQAGKALRAGARANKIVRIFVRVLKYSKVLKVFRYTPKASMRLKAVAKVLSETGKVDDVPEKSRVGAAMTDLMNQRVVILVIVMLIVVPLLNISEIDNTQLIAVELLQQMAVYNANSTSSYGVGLRLTLDNIVANTKVLSVQINDVSYISDAYRISELRPVERALYRASSNGVHTTVIFDNLSVSQAEARFSMYTTLFVTFLLVVGTYFFSSDVNRLIIGPIERLVDLVRKISANPLGVEYKMLGEKEGFLDGMETTILLTTINKIGGLMQVGFGEAGATVIAKNLADSSGGRLNLMGGGTMIQSIFGFCDVRQFTDTTECLQEEVMLFVNRIAFILHDIVVQCSGSANKNIGDAFLLAWKIDDKMSENTISILADKALLAFLKTLIEISRHQKYICAFSAGATERLLKRFPDYNVRIGSGLHVGWAIEGAIGSNRKIDASYLSPHVNFTEFLESSTKEYGIPLLLSEPFYKLLSPQAQKYCRQVDRIKRTNGDEPIGLFTYDCDMNIDWNDSSRHFKKGSTAFKEKAVRGDRPGGIVRRKSFTGFGPEGAPKSTKQVSTGGQNSSSNKIPLSRELSKLGPVSRSNSGKLSALEGSLGQNPLPPSAASNTGGSKVFSFKLPSIRPRMASIRQSTDEECMMEAITALHASQTRGPTRDYMLNLNLNLKKDGLKGSPGPPNTQSIQGSPRGTRRSRPYGDLGKPTTASLERRKSTTDQQHDIELGLSDDVPHDTEKVPKIFLHTYTTDIWDVDMDIVDMRHLINSAFRQQWDKGINAYIKGDWQKARDIFQETVKLPGGGEDGPSKFLIDLIDDYGGIKPAQWKEYRQEGHTQHS